MAPKTFTNWKECCKYLFELIGRNKVLAGKNTIIEDTGSGIRVHSQAGGSGSGAVEYTGIFKIIDSSEGETKKIKLVNGAYEDDANCGSWSFGSLSGNCPRTEITITAKIYIYLKLTFDPEAKTCTGQILSGAALPANSATVDIMHIGTVYADMTIQQVYNSSAAYTVINRWTL